MMKNKKPLIGILVIIIILAGGWWIWSSQITQPSEKACKSDPDCVCVPISSAEVNYDNWCINKKQVDKSLISRWCECKCKNGRCEFVKFIEPEPIAKEQVIITTDNTEYIRGEIIKLIVKNNLNKSRWYWADNKCKNYSNTVVRFSIEGNDFMELYYPLQFPVSEERGEPVFKELKPYEQIILEFSWEHMITGPIKGGFHEEYKVEMLIYEEDPQGVFIGPGTEIESNKFVIK